MGKGKHGRVGCAAGYQAADLIEIQLAGVPGHQADYEYRNESNEGAIEYPHVTAPDNGTDETLAGAKSHCSHEEGYTYLTEHHVGTLGGVDGYLPAGAEITEQYGNDQGASGKSEFYRLRNAGEPQRYASKEYT